MEVDEVETGDWTSSSEGASGQSKNPLERMRVRLAADTYNDKSKNYETLTEDSDEDERRTGLCSRENVRRCCTAKMPVMTVVVIFSVMAMTLIGFMLVAVFLALRLNSLSRVCKSTECVVIGGEMLSRMNVSVDPCDDFYRYACESFITDDTVPPNEPYYSTLGSSVRYRRVARMRKMYHWADEALATVLCLLMVTTYGNATRRCYSCSDCATVSDAHRQHAASCPRVCMIKVYLKEGKITAHRLCMETEGFIDAHWSDTKYFTGPDEPYDAERTYWCSTDFCNDADLSAIDSIEDIGKKSSDVNNADEGETEVIGTAASKKTGRDEINAFRGVPRRGGRNGTDGNKEITSSKPNVTHIPDEKSDADAVAMKANDVQLVLMVIIAASAVIQIANRYTGLVR